MKKLILPLIIASTSLLAQTHGYELRNFSGSKVRTIEQLLTETNLSKDELQKYSCKREDRFELFLNTTIKNMALDSLKVVTANNKVLTYQDGKLFNSNNNEIRTRDSFAKKVLKTLKRYETIPETRQLIMELQASPYPFHIKKGGNRYSPHHATERPAWHMNNATMVMNLDEKKPMVDGLPFDQIGYGGQILWNPKTKASFMEADGVQRKIDTDIILAHELYHAYDGMRGLLDRRFVHSDKHEFQPVTEYRAVRMENILRHALGYKLRKYYSYSEEHSNSDKDMLDENGETIIMPAPCIHWLD